jgi:hypothetical protein
MLRLVALVRTDVLEDLSSSFIMVARIGELGTTLTVTSNRRTQRRNTKCYFFAVPPKHRFLQGPHGVTSQKMAFFIVTAVKTWNLTNSVVIDIIGSTISTPCFLVISIPISSILQYSSSGSWVFWNWCSKTYPPPPTSSERFSSL